MSTNIDSLFKKAYQNRHAEPPAYIWENINRQLQVNKRRRKIILWRYRTAAAIALLLAVSGIAILKNTSDTVPVFYSSSVRPVNKLEYILPESRLAVIVPAVYKVSAIEERVPQKRTVFSEIIPERLDEEKVASLTFHGPSINLKQKDYIPLVNKQSYKTLQLYNQILEAEQSDKKFA